MNLLIPIISFFLSLIITWFIKQVCIYHGIVELPRKDRWHESPVAKFGGIAIFVTFIVSILLLDQFSDLVIFIGIGSALIFFIGLIDDIISISPTIKLLTQIIIAVGSYIVGFQFFINAPDYENPQDVDKDNIYDVEVSVTDTNPAAKKSMARALGFVTSNSDYDSSVRVTNFDEDVISKLSKKIKIKWPNSHIWPSLFSGC